MTSLRPYAPRVRSLADVAAAAGLAAAPTQIPAFWHGIQVTGVTHDSRQVRTGDLYAALPGEHHHGADFAVQAARGGAAAILTDPLGRERAGLAGLPVVIVRDPRAVLGAVAADIYGHPSRDLLMIGVTGTNGKTTTAYLLDAGLRVAGHRTGLIGTVETRLRDEIVTATRTTPEAPELQALLAVMRERGVTAVAMEVSSHALALGRVDGITYDVALFTNLSQDHLDFHFSLESYYRAKAELFTEERSHAAVVNIDDSYGRRLANEARVPVTTFSCTGTGGADWRAEQMRHHPRGSTFTVVGPRGVHADAEVCLPGRFNVANALGAIVALVTAGVPLDDAILGVADCAGVPGRMEAIDAGQPYLAVVDYAHTPDAVETLLVALREVTKGRLIAVLGAGGDRDRAKRPLMGEAAARLADVLVITDDNPRSEDPEAIIRAILSGAQQVPDSARAEVHVEHDRAAAIGYAVRAAGPVDTVVVAGKGHETGQEINRVIRPFDDRAVLRHAIESALSGAGRAGAGQ
jgi:UDP-N-acetylmuramoyl-L-alanyl-D-glutamate--2,6-diaminopimelate ligase